METLIVSYVSVDSLRVHKAAGDIPEMSAVQWTAFLASVEATQKIEQPLDVCGDVVIDGRHRLKAAIAAGFETVPVIERDLDEVEQINFMVRHAKDRRHLTPAQWSLLGAKLKPKYEEAAKARKLAGKSPDLSADMHEGQKGRSSDMAAKAVGVSGRSVDYAEEVLTKGIPELIAKVERGEIGVSTAAPIARMAPEKQKETLDAGVDRREVLRDRTPKKSSNPKPQDTDEDKCWELLERLAQMTKAPQLKCPYSEIKTLVAELKSAYVRRYGRSK